MLFDENCASVGFAHTRFDVCQFDYWIVIFFQFKNEKMAREYVRKHSLTLYKSIRLFSSLWLSAKSKQLKHNQIQSS